MDPRVSLPVGLLVLVILGAGVVGQGTYLASFKGWSYYKVPVTGTMTSINVKNTCQAAGYVAPCPGESTCQYSSSECVLTGLTQCTLPMNEVSLELCGTNPNGCSQFHGVYQFMNNWGNGAACGALPGSWCNNGNGQQDRYAFCARVENCCGNILRHETLNVDQSTSFSVPAGWTMCYIDQRDTAYHNTPCQDLLQGIPQYGNAQQLLAAGGNFGCWHGNTGDSPGPAYASNGVIRNSCRDGIQQSNRLSSWSPSTTTFGVCIRGITCAPSRVDGGWTDWGPWSACSVTCGVGTETRGRTCTNPAPANGGADCDGLDQDTQDCDTGVLCPVDGGWTDWSPWSACSVTCGVGTETRDRTCTNPAPANGGADCDGLDQETQDCDTGVICSAVSDLTFHDIETDQMTLSWTASADVTRYRLRYRHAGASYQDLSPPPAPGDTNATIRGLWADTEYNCTLTAFGEDDEEIGEISGTETTDKVIVNVDCHQDYMTVTFPRAALTEVNVETMHLLNDSCRATYTETEVTLRTGLQECGTTQESSEDKIIFSNEAFGSPVEQDNGAVRGATFRKRFQCEFVSQFVVSQERNILFNIPPPRVEVVNAENQFTFEMHMFPSADFTDTYRSADYPVQVTPSDHLNFGLSVNSPLDNLELLALHCLATPSTDPADSPSVSIIQDGCDIDTTLQLNTDLSNDMALYYSIQSFTFPNVVDPSLVYIHCTMVVCFKDDPDSRCSEGCIPARRRRRAVSDMSEARVRRASERDQTAHMTQGPFQVKNGQEQASTLPTVGIAVGTAAGIAGVLLLAVAVFLVRKRRRRDVKDQTEDRVGFDNYSFELWGKGKAANATPKPE
ncbi:uncharacterized protein LOC144923909 isoform X2 [Branchiostoma floridae x Branchiostoma belcheri]